MGCIVLDVAVYQCCSEGSRSEIQCQCNAPRRVPCSGETGLAKGSVVNKLAWHLNRIPPCKSHENLSANSNIHLPRKIKAGPSSKTLLIIYQTIRCHMPECQNFR